MIGSGCTTTPPESQLSAQAWAVLEGLPSRATSVTIDGRPDCWMLALPQTERTCAWILRLPTGPGTGRQVGPGYRSHTLVTTDGDAADVHLRLTGEEHPTLEGEMSDAYKAFRAGMR